PEHGLRRTLNPFRSITFVPASTMRHRSRSLVADSLTMVLGLLARSEDCNDCGRKTEKHWLICACHLNSATTSISITPTRYCWIQLCRRYSERYLKTVRTTATTYFSRPALNSSPFTDRPAPSFGVT